MLVKGLNKEFTPDVSITNVVKNNDFQSFDLNVTSKLILLPVPEINRVNYTRNVKQIRRSNGLIYYVLTFDTNGNWVLACVDDSLVLDSIAYVLNCL